ncbi:hypothetical protein [Fontivita pretiosa]|uniref:hypothetical protein n=1 Tax=Fontivita pretiosa TaxID=2989684 RepID=UPI003D17FCC9
MRHWKRMTVMLLAGAAMSWPAVARARIKLITLPVRERVEIQLDHQDVTLVEEERIVPLVKGENQVDFSWSNTQIDPNTIVFRVIGPGAADQPQLDVKVLSVSYPPNEPSLVWAVGASDSGSARVRISYVLGNLSKSFNYRAIASNDEKTLSLSQYLRLQNLANEEFGSSELWAGFGTEFRKPIGINQTMEMLMARIDNVPVRKTWTCDLEQFGYLDPAQQKLRVPMHYVIRNDKASRLGTAALPFGKVRIFIEGQREGATAFLGEDWGQFTPIDDEMKLYLGVAQDVVVRRTIERSNTTRVAGNLWNQEVIIKYEIENFKDKPITLDVCESLRMIRNQLRGDTGRDVQWEMGNETTFKPGPDAERSTSDRLVFHADLPARGNDGKAEKIVHKLHLILKNEW